MKRTVLVFVLALVGSGRGMDYVQNGGFEDSLHYWSVEYSNPDTSGVWQVDVGPGYNPDPDNEVYLYKFNREYARIRQATSPTTLNVTFSASAKLLAAELTGLGWWSYAAVVVEYRSALNFLLGRTMIIKKTPWCTLTNSPTQHLIVVTSDAWENYSFDLLDELENLSGVNPNDISTVQIVLESYSIGQEC